MSANHVSIKQVQQLIADGAELPYVVTDTLKAYEAKCASESKQFRLRVIAELRADHESTAREAAESAYEVMKQERDALRVHAVKVSEALSAMGCPSMTVIEGISWLRERAEAADATVARLRELSTEWLDPEFWREKGALMDAIDCAHEIKAALSASSPTPREE